MRKPRFAKQFIFWLNLEDDKEYEIAQSVADLKNRKQFSSTIRNGIRLIVDLSKGQTKVLKELYPNIVETLLEQNRENSNDNSANGGGIPDNVLDNAANILMEKLTYKMQQGNTVSNASQPTHNAHTATPAYTLNDLPVLTSKKAKSNGHSAQALLSAMSAMSGTKRITLKPEVPKVASIIAGSEKPLLAPIFENLEI